MDLALIKLLVDTSLFILIWIVQLVVYPGFRYYAQGDMKKWHPLYTQRITIPVMPLMLGQLALYGLACYQEPSVLRISQLALVLSTWGLTFFFAVPLHAAIEDNQNSLAARAKLVRVNWPRTLIWTLIFILNLLTYEQ